MPSQLALESLKALTGGTGYRPRVLPTEDYGFSGAVPTQGELDSPWERENARTANAANARDLETAHEAEDLNRDLFTFNRPDVTQVREQQQKDALEKMLAPIRLKGQYDVEAAKQQQLGQSQRDERLFGNRMTAQNDAQASQDARAGANQKSAALRQQRTSVVAQLAKASGSGLGNMFGLTGPSQKDTLTKQLADIDAQLTSASNDPGEAPVNAGVMPSDSGETAAQQLARLRAGGRR